MPPTKNQPPYWAKKFFNWYCNPILRESIEGDLEERFDENVLKKGVFRARVFYCLDVMRFMNRYTLKKTSKRRTSNRLERLGQNVRHSYRFLRKHKAYALINTAGLALGMAATLMILRFVYDEITYDRFVPGGEQVYRVNIIYQNEQGSRFSLANSAPVYAREFPKNIPAIETATRMRYAMRTRLALNEISFYEDHGYYADSLFFDVLPYELLEGDPDQVLDEPNTMVITEELAMKYFNKARPIGEFLTLNGQKPIKITGILAPIPAQSHLQFDFLISFSSYEIPAGYASDLNSWSWGGFLTYTRVAAGTDITALNRQANQLIANNTSRGGTQILVHLQPLHNIYLGSADFPDDLNSQIRSGSPLTVYALSVIALLIMAICGFNYTNLTAALALQRTREMGIRKVLGANSGSIRWQLFADALLISLSSLCLALVLVWSFEPILSGWFNWSLNLQLQEFLAILPWSLAGVIALALVISGYPALFFNRLKAMSAIKNQFNTSKRGTLTRRSLVTLQFCISLGLLSAAMIIKDQLQFMSEQKMGIDKESLLTIQMLPEDLERHYASLKTQWEMNSHLAKVTRSERLVGDPWPMNVLLPVGKDPSESIQVSGNLVGLDYLGTHGVKMKEGRFFSAEYPGDTLQSIVINQATADLLGGDNLVGTEVMFFSRHGPRRIIGIMEDFHFSSLHQEIGPMVLIMPFIDLEQITLRVTPGDLRSKINAIESVWNEVTEGLPLDLRFMDDRLNQLYKAEAQLGSLVSFFSGLAIILAALGLYGLISFSTRSRLKEISIRKVIGANQWSLLKLLSREYVLLLGIAALMATPLSHYLLQYWLSHFAYGIDLDPSYFAFSLLAFALLCLATISGQVLKVLRQNPVKHLKDD